MMQRHKATGDNSFKDRKQLSELRSEYCFIKNENDANLIKIEQLREQLKSAQQTLMNLEDECSDLTITNSALQTERKGFKSMIDSLTKQNAELQYKLTTSNILVNEQKLLIDGYKNNIQELEDLRRVMHNQIQDLKGTIRVFCRIRPPLPSEQNKPLCSFTYTNDDSVKIKRTRENGNKNLAENNTEFVFDKVFQSNSTQIEIFNDISQLIQSVMDGYNVCVFAYGQTGSGKTYTMQGEDENYCSGVIPKSVDLIFRSIKKYQLTGWMYNVEVSVLEIYNETVRDLLNIVNKESLEIRYNDGKGTTVRNLTILPVHSAQELHDLMHHAEQNRAVAITNFNEHSSRSHAVTKITVTGTNDSLKTVYCASLSLVDLAGSESPKTSNRIKETKNINKSLSTLGTVMTALQNKDSHIPYRNSKLTYLLQSSLGGNSKTLMIVNIAPLEEYYNESISTLRFATKVKRVKTMSVKNKTCL